MAAFEGEDRELMEGAAKRIVRARMTVPAMMMLETVTPMNMVTSSMLHMMSPVWRIALPNSRIDQVAHLLERRDAIPEFIKMIDDAEEASRRDG